MLFEHGGWGNENPASGLYGASSPGITTLVATPVANVSLPSLARSTLEPQILRRIQCYQASSN
jgi:hypothetical protein